MKRKALRGIIPAMLTPFDKNQQLDTGAARKLARYLINNGVHGLFIAGTNGEAHLMSHDEVTMLTSAVADETEGRVPVCAGAGRCSTMETIVLANRLKDAGADYISLVTPYYLVPSQADLYHHYKTIAEHVDAPLLLYNIPSQTGMKIDTETAEKLALIDNICGIKDSGGDFEIQKTYIKLSGEYDFDVLNGSDSLILEAFKAGSPASVAATANVLPGLEVALYNHFLSGELDRAQELRNKMDPLRMALKKATAPCVMKMVMRFMGIDAGIPRLPVQEPDENLTQLIQQMLSQYGF